MKKNYDKEKNWENVLGKDASPFPLFAIEILLMLTEITLKHNTNMWAQNLQLTKIKNILSFM